MTKTDYANNRLLNAGVELALDNIHRAGWTTKKFGSWEQGFCLSGACRKAVGEIGYYDSGLYKEIQRRIRVADPETDTVVPADWNDNHATLQLIHAVLSPELNLPEEAP